MRLSSQPADRPLVVLQSSQPRSTSNPYILQLYRSLRAVPGMTVRTFDWRTALLGRYDVFHVHWPENLAKGRSPAKSLARRMLTRLFLARLRAARIPIVRTMHNLERPEGLSAGEYRILDSIDAATVLRIRLNEFTPVPETSAVETIPHGHYRDWFASYPQSDAIQGRLGYFGLIRRYKNVAHLVRVVRDLADTFSLRVAGSPSNVALEREIEEARAGDPRIVLDFHFLDDAELVEVVTESELVVLPYREMHNSGSVLASLSLDRPVLVRDNAVNRALAAEVGDGWIHFYEGDLSAQDALATHRAVTTHPPAARPDLRAREWGEAAARHGRAYRRAISIARRDRRR